jgi:hypothetical protein
MFWSNSAGPSALQLWNPFEEGGRILRSESAKKPSPWHDLVQPVVCNLTHASELTAFLRKEYKGDDWTLNLSVEKVRSILSNSIALLAMQNNEIIGCILSRPLGGILQGFHIGLDQVRVIEGLCVRSDQRGNHLAGWLIAWADFYTSQHRPTIHIWYRELPSTPSYWTSTAMQIESYSYVKTELIVLDTAIMVQIPLEIWDPVWKEQITSVGCAYSDGRLDTEDLLCFSPVEIVPPSLFSMVIIVNTHRLTSTGRMIWEVLWCSSTGAYRRLNGVGFQLEAIGKGGLLFATDAKDRGGITGGCPSPWLTGRAGVHCTYFYNYIPPIRPLRLVALRGCI